MKIRRKLDEYGMIIPNDLELKFYGGGKGGAGVVDRHPFPQPAPAAIYAPAPVTPVSTPVSPTQAPVTQDTAATPEEEEAKKLKEASKSGAKSLQIPLTGNTSGVSDATKAVGTI